MAVESGFIVVRQYRKQYDPVTKQKVHPKVILNGSHIVGIEQAFLPDQEKDLTTRDATIIKMFGMSDIRIKETADEVIQMMKAAGFTMRAFNE